jgi:hypothetical protein
MSTLERTQKIERLEAFKKLLLARHILRYGVSPAESDIARHFLVFAPSVSQMVQMLERRGFIRRQFGIPRSITIVDYREDLARPPQAAAAGGRRRNSAFRRTPGPPLTPIPRP